MKHKYYIFVYPTNETPAPQKNETPAPQKNEGHILVVEKVMPVKRWAKANGRKLYIQKVY